MTALDKYARLETEGTWRSGADAQRRNVVVSLGEATLVLSDGAGRALTHWSLPAVTRINPGATPALFGPDSNDPNGETLELSDDAMIAAIAHVQATVARRKPHPGRLRRVGLALSTLTLIILAVFRAPGAVIDYTVKVLPQVKRATLDDRLSAEFTRLTGAPCSSPFADAALNALATRLALPKGTLEVRRLGLAEIFVLPGGRIILDRSLIEDPSAAEVTAGYILAAQAQAWAYDPLAQVFESTGPMAAIATLTGNGPSQDRLAVYAETLLMSPSKPLDQELLLPVFKARMVASTPYAYARDITGETTLTLIEADPMTGSVAPPVLSDRDWLSLRSICGP